MRHLSSMRKSLLAIAAAVILGGAGAAGAQSPMSEEAVRAWVEDSYPVEVLKVEQGEVDGVDAWMVTMMTEGGDFNSAFQVNTIAVNRQTGELIPSFRHGPSGYKVPPSLSGAPGTEIHPNRMQQGPWR